MKRVLILLTVFSCLFADKAKAVQENIEVSVLTCSPGQELYSYYGHTAIRVKDRMHGTDYVFNYGVFDFNSEHFLWRFVLGRTDYICMATPWNYFVREYESTGRGVVAQVLNLTEAESLKFRDYLYNNIREENRVYRYNFLTNNCTTKVMDCVDACVEGELLYSWNQQSQTYRQILYSYTGPYPWAQEGNDALLGADVDTVLTHRATCFVPENYFEVLEGAMVRNDFQDTRKLVLRTDTLLRARTMPMSTDGTLPFTPAELGWIMFAVSVLIMCMEFYFRKMFWVLDVLIMLVHGLAGCLISFLFFFSEHPALDSNWLVGILNPLPLLILPMMLKAAWKDSFCIWHHFMAVWIAFYMLFIPWMPQQMGGMLIPVLSVLLSRQLSYIFHYGRVSMPAPRKKSRKKTTKKR